MHIYGSLLPRLWGNWWSSRERALAVLTPPKFTHTRFFMDFIDEINWLRSAGLRVQVSQQSIGRWLIELSTSFSNNCCDSQYNADPCGQLVQSVRLRPPIALVQWPRGTYMTLWNWITEQSLIIGKLSIIRDYVNNDWYTWCWLYQFYGGTINLLTSSVIF